MFLKKIYVNGFKSFAEKTEVIVEKGITAIVGPNGSGKSNIADAIKWVLGEQSAKSLRGGKMEDVIFAGTQKRMPLGYAEVNLLFDNEDGTLPIEYKEVSIKRKLYKTGESEYYINKQHCRLKDIKEMFMDTGIGRDGYSVIGQGRVEDILSPNSDVRRTVFEEAVGIVKYKARKEESIKKLEKTNDNLDRVNDIVKELSKRIEPLKDQSERAKKYVELKNDLKQCELNYFVREYEKHKDQLTALESQKEQSISQKENLCKVRENLEIAISLGKEKINELEKSLTETETIQIKRNREYENAVSLCSVQSEKRMLFRTNIKNVSEEIEALEERDTDLRADISSIEEEKLSLVEKLKIQTEKFDDINKDIEEYRKEIDVVLTDIDNKRNELFELHKTINKMNSSKSTYESFIKNDEERIEYISKEIQSEKQDKTNKEEIISMLELEQNEIKGAILNRKQEYTDHQNEFKGMQNSKITKEIEIKKMNDDLTKVKSKFSILSNMETYYDGYYKSVQTLMNNKQKNEMLKNSILGTVAEIIKTKKEYETAIEIALGSAIQNVIVNSEMQAENIIEYLKINKIGRVTFLPIAMLQERGLNNSEKAAMSDPSVINTADMLVESDSSLQKVIRHLLGRTIIVDNIKNGFRVSKKAGNSIRVVSLQGDVINPGGSVTGGHISNNQNLLGRKREIEECKKYSEEYAITLKTKNEEYTKLIDAINLCTESMESIKNEINEKNNLVSTSDAKMNMLREQKNKTESVINKYRTEQEFMIEEKNKHIKEIEKTDAEVERYKTIISESEKNIEDISKQNETNRDEFERYNQSLLKQRDELSLINQEMSLKEERINNIMAEIGRNSKTRLVKMENLESIETEIKISADLIEEYTKTSKQSQIDLELINVKHSNDKSDLLNFQNQIYKDQGDINEANKKITEILDDENQMNVKLERSKSRIEDISVKLWEEYEMSYAMALSYKDETIGYTKMYSDVNTYKKAIKDLGDINVSAIEEYKEVKERYDFLTVQKKDLIDAAYALNDVIKELEIKMKEKFLEEFAGIRIQFSEVFKKLFNGGKGDVYLEDEKDALNSNIEIAVQPPGKKLSKISLLSGGEKSLTAIALLFAILKTKATPFCILDEIEAALDDSNIYRFTQYLKEFSKETQFLVITHRKGTMEYADTLYGTTMEEKGVTKLVSMKLSEIN